PSICEPGIDSYGGGKGEAPHFRAGLLNLLQRISGSAGSAVRLAVRLAAADQASPGRPVGHPAAVGRASGLDSGSSFFPLQYWFATSIARFPWRESIRGQCIRSTIHSRFTE